MKDQLHILMLIFFDTVHSHIWYVSDDGSDDNDCHSVYTQCKNLQTILDRATDGADIYVTSHTLSQDLIQNRWGCIIHSNLSYTLISYHDANSKLTCPGMFIG